MLGDLLKALQKAKNTKEKERIYKALQRLGVDKMTVNIILKEINNSI